MQKNKLLFLSILSGLLLAFSWPARGLAPLLLFAFVPLLYVEEQLFKYKSKHLFINIFAYFFPAFFLWNLLTCYWIVYATIAGAFVAIMLNSIMMTSAVLLFHLCRRFINKKHHLTYFILPLLWLSYEYFHTNWELSWPWLTLGNGFAACPMLIQWYEYTGTSGGTLWILITNISAYKLLSFILSESKSLKSILTSSINVILVIAIPIVISLYRFYNYIEKGESASVTVVQPNIDPWNEKFNSLTPEAQIRKIIYVSIPYINNNTDLLICPETAIAEGVWEDFANENPNVQLLQKLAGSFPKLYIITGLDSYLMYKSATRPTSTAHKYEEGEESWYDIYNTAMLIDTGGAIGFYHKSKLVPGVERIPYPSVFGIFEKQALYLGGMPGSRGLQEDRTTFKTTNSLNIAPVICYESIFGEFITSYMKNGANIIAIITNDGWWKDTPGYRQHFQYARLRAIENRRCVARSANTGISGFISQRGLVISKSEFNTATALNASLNLNNDNTFYSKYGDYLGRISVFASTLLILSVFFKFIFKNKFKSDKRIRI